jgi:hypothetical protein
MKIYGIHIGSIYEGGGTSKDLYREKGDAIEEALRLFGLEVSKHKARLDKAKNDFMTNHIMQYAWKKCEDEEDRWFNTVEEIRVQEYNVK